MVPSCVPKMALSSDIPTTQVNIASFNGPRRQFLPANVFGTGLAVDLSCTLSKPRRPFEGDDGCSSLQILTWRVPTLTTLVPIQATVPAAVHRFDESSLKAPVFGLIDHRKRPPSCESPKEHSHRESGEKANARTPKVCSVKHARGTSVGALEAVEKIRIRGRYPIYNCQRVCQFHRSCCSCTSPAARNLPDGLSATQVKFRDRWADLSLPGESALWSADASDTVPDMRSSLDDELVYPRVPVALVGVAGL